MIPFGVDKRPVLTVAMGAIDRFYMMFGVYSLIYKGREHKRKPDEQIPYNPEYFESSPFQMGKLVNKYRSSIQG